MSTTLFNASFLDTKHMVFNPEKDGMVIIKTPDKTLTLSNGEVCHLFLNNKDHIETQDLSSSLIRYMRQNLTIATLKSIAEHFYYHPNTVSAILRRDLGMSFSELLLDIRMEHARCLLLETDLPIVWIAEKCGYHHMTSFYHAFYKKYQMTPNDYRKSCDQNKVGPA